MVCQVTLKYGFFIANSVSRPKVAFQPTTSATSSQTLSKSGEFKAKMLDNYFLKGYLFLRFPKKVKCFEILVRREI